MPARSAISWTVVSRTPWWLSAVGAGTSLATVIAMHVTFCIGMAMIMTPLMTASLGSLPRTLYGHGSAIVNTLQQLAGAAGTAILIAAMSIGASKAAADGAGAVAAQVTGTREAFVLGGIVGLVAVVSAPFVSRPRPEVPAVEEKSAAERAPLSV